MNSKLNRDWIIFFTAPHVEKIFIRYLQKIRVGGLILLEKIIRKYRMGKQINIKEDCYFH